MNIVSKYLTICFAALGLVFQGCSTAKYTEAQVYKKSASRPNQPSEKVFSFVIEDKKPFTIQPQISIDGNNIATFSILSVTDSKNEMIDFKSQIPSGKYTVKASTKEETVKITEGISFTCVINGKQVKIKPEIKKDVLSK